MRTTLRRSFGIIALVAAASSAGAGTVTGAICCKADAGATNQIEATLADASGTPPSPDVGPLGSVDHLSALQPQALGQPVQLGARREEAAVAGDLPEPATLFLLFLGLVGMIIVRRRYEAGRMAD